MCQLFYLLPAYPSKPQCLLVFLCKGFLCLSKGLVLRSQHVAKCIVSLSLSVELLLQMDDLLLEVGDGLCELGYLRCLLSFLLTLGSVISTHTF